MNFEVASIALTPESKKNVAIARLLFKKVVKVPMVIGGKEVMVDKTKSKTYTFSFEKSFDASLLPKVGDELSLDVSGLETTTYESEYHGYEYPEGVARIKENRVYHYVSDDGEITTDKTDQPHMVTSSETWLHAAGELPM